MSRFDELTRKPVRWLADLAVNDSDKTFTVPDDRCWEIISLYAEVFTFNSGNARRFGIDIRAADALTVDVVYSTRAINTQVANATEYYHAAQSGLEATETTAAQHYLSIPLGLILQPGWSIRFWDVNAITEGVAADDMAVHLLIKEYGVIR